MPTLAAVAILLALPWIRGGGAREGSPPPQPAPREDRVMLLTVTDPAYGRLTIPESARVVPSATERLLVFRKGACVVDRGLRSIRRAASGGSEGEEGLFENASVAPDGSGAAIAATRWEVREDRTAVEARIVWVDPFHPDGSWILALEPGRQIKELVALPLAFGAAVATFVEGDPVVDVRRIGPDGHELSRSSPQEGSVVDLAVSDDGGFLGVDFALPPKEGEPDRAIVVIDLAKGGSWRYGWTYGSDREPLGWHLESGGVLEITTAERPLRFDARGVPLRRSRRGR